MANILAEDNFGCIFLIPIGSGEGLVPTRQQAIAWNNAAQIHTRIYVALGGDELNNKWVANSDRWNKLQTHQAVFRNYIVLFFTAFIISILHAVAHVKWEVIILINPSVHPSVCLSVDDMVSGA